MHKPLLHTIEAGSPADPVVVFLHAGPLSSRMWLPQLERLDDEFYCLAPDLPGHGKSQDKNFTLETAAHEVAELIRAKSPDGKATVIGLSLGGAVVLTLLRMAPEMVERAMVSGTSGKLGRFLGTLSLATAGLTRLVKPEYQAASMLTQMNVPEQFRDLLLDDLVQGASPSYTRYIVQALMKMELPTRISCPFLVAVGEKETIPAREAAKKLLEIYPQAQRLVLPGLHHLWNLEAPDLFAVTVRAWVNGAPLPTG